MTHTLSQKLIRIATALAAGLALASCGSGDSGPELPPTAKVRIAQVSYKAALPLYKALADDMVGRPTIPSFDWAPVATPVTGLTVGGVRLPDLSGWGSTPYVEVPAGTHTLSILPAIPNADAQKFTFAPGAVVTLVRGDSDTVPWMAYFETPLTPIAAGEIEIGVLHLEASTSTGAYRSVKVELQTDNGDVLVADAAASNAFELVASRRLAAVPFRVVAFSRSSGTRLFRSALVSLKGGQRWNGKLFLRETTDTARSLSFYSDQSVNAVTALDDRSAIRAVNFSAETVTVQLPALSKSFTEVALAPGSTVTYFANAGAGLTARVLKAGSVLTNENMVPLPALLPGRAYDLVVTAGASAGKFNVNTLPEPWTVSAVSPNDAAGCSWRWSAVLNATAPGLPLQMEIVLPPPLPFWASGPQAYAPKPFAAGQAGLLQLCRFMVPNVFPLRQVNVIDTATGQAVPVQSLETITLSTSNVALPDEGTPLNDGNFQRFGAGINGVLEGSVSGVRLRAVSP